MLSDDDLRRYFDEIKEGMRLGHGKLEGRIDGLTNAVNQHSLESGVRYAEVDARARSAHRRLDEHMELHDTADERRFQAKLQGKGMLIATWVAILTTLATLVVTIVLALAGKG